MKTSHRFSGTIGEEYYLFKKSVPYYATLQQLVAKAIHIHFKKKNSPLFVVELGFGTGPTTRAILDLNKNAGIVAIDNEPVMHRYAKKHLQKHIQKKRLRLAKSDALAYLKRTKTGSVDAVASCFTIHNFGRPYRKKVIREIFRVLKKGGLFVNSDKFALDNSVAHKAALEWQFEQYIKAFVPMNRNDLVVGWMVHDLEDEKVIPTEKEAILQLKNAGFAKVKKIFRKRIHATIVAVK